MERYKKQRLNKPSTKGGDRVSQSATAGERAGGRTETTAPGTVNLELAALSHLFSKAVEWGWITHKPAIKKFKLDNARTHYLTTEQIGASLAAAPGQVWLFPSDTSETGHVVSIEKAFTRVVAAAGLDPRQVIRHTLRHTAITHLVQAGIDLPTVQLISGHKTLAMVARYSHQNGTHIREALNKLESRYRPPAETAPPAARPRLAAVKKS